MSSARPLLTALSLIAAFILTNALHAAVAKPMHVKAALVSADASVQPGQALTVAVRLEHAPHWHTYWINPGTGLATTIEWTLPPNWQAGEIQWPAPHLLKDKSGNIVGNGFENELFLPVTLTPPSDLAAGSEVTLLAQVDWLMCEDVCIPGDAKLSLTLPVSAEPPKPDPNWGDKIRATIAGLPRADPAWKATASHDGKNVTLHVAQASSPAPANAGETPAQPSNLRFFADDNFVAYDQPQKIESDGKGGFILTLPLSPEADKNAPRLIGVLTSETGWLPNGELRGLRVDVPFSSQLSALGSQPGSAGSQLSSLNSQPSSGLAGTLLLAFLGGLILNLMPCVFPVLGIKILGFVNQAGHQRSKIVAHGLIFTAGVLLSFWALAALLAVLRAGGDQLGWGFQLQSPAFVYALAVLLLVFGMNMSGVFEFGLSATSVGSGLQSKSGYGGSFFTGVLATVVATPCSAPFLAPALGAALAVSTTQSFAIFTAIAIGLSTPYLLLSIFPQAVKILPRPGGWMETFKQFMAFPLYATVGALVWVLMGQVSEDRQLTVILSLVLVALGVWMYGRWHAPGAKPARARFGIASLIVVSGLGVWLGWPRTAVAQPVDGAPPQVVWEPWSPEAVAKLREQDRIVYVDFTARWCATCQTNKKLVFSSDEVLRTFANKNIATLRADWTNQDPRITAELAAYGRSAVPFNVIWMPGKAEPVILPELLTPSIVLDALKNAEAPAQPAGAVVTQAAP